MDCENIRELLAGYQDGELNTDQKALVEQHLNQCRACREELEKLEKVKEVTNKVKYDDLPLEVWQGYWQNLYRRLERGIGWVFTSIGAIILLITGGFYLVRDYFMDAAVPLLPKLGVGALIIGGVFLLVSVARERLFAYNRERYREVQR